MRFFKKSRTICISLIAVVALGLFFQNCSQAQFVSVDDPLSVVAASSTNAVFEGKVLMGDMLVDASAVKSTRNGQKAIGFATYRSRPWPNGKVFIDVETHAVSQELVTRLREACAQWTANSKAECIFVRPNEVENPLFISSYKLGCWTSLGYNTTVSWQRSHPNQMNMEPSCFDKHSTLHEMGHVFGLIHEHQRYDRDNYIQVDMENIKPEWRDAWTKIGEAFDLQNFNKKYDIGSIMHYGQYTGSNINPNNPSYAIKAGGQNFGFQTVLSDEDKTAIADIYGYASNPVVTPPVTPGTPSDRAAKIVFSSVAKGDGKILRYLKHTVQGGGAGLLACTGLSQNINSTCLNKSDFIKFGVYNATTDTYVMEASGDALVPMQMPQTSYFSRFLASDGSQVTKTWTSETEIVNFLVDSSSGRALSIRLIDKSEGTGFIVTSIDQQTFGGGPGLRACTQPVANIRTGCNKLEDFVPMPGAYNSFSDVYPTKGTGLQWPFTEYFSRYLATDGSHVTIKWLPKNVNTP